MKKRIFILVMLVCMLFCQVVYAIDGDRPLNGDKPAWISSWTYNSKYDYTIVYDEYKEPSIEKCKQLCYYFYGDIYCSFEYYQIVGDTMRCNYYGYVPDAETRVDLDAGCELMLLPTSFQFVDGKKHSLSSLCYVKDNKIVKATGEFVDVHSQSDGSFVVTYDTGIRLVPYYENYVYTSTVKMYVDDYSSYEDIANLQASILNGEIHATNEDDFLPKRYGVIEPPQNLQFVDKGFFSDNKTSFSWTQTDERYRSWDTEIMIHVNLGYKLTIDLFGSFDETGTLLLCTDTIKTSTFRYSVVLVDLIQKNRHVYQNIIAEKYGDKGTHVQLKNCTFSFRNRYSDGQYTYYSNWVKVYIDEDEDYAIEYDYDDKIHGDENVDYTYKPPNGNNSSDSSYTGSSVNGDTSISDLANALTNGFGLAGENGMIDMFSDMFGFIPTPVWTLILTGISVLIAIALLKAVL